MSSFSDWNGPGHGDVNPIWMSKVQDLMNQITQLRNDITAMNNPITGVINTDKIRANEIKIKDLCEVLGDFIADSNASVQGTLTVQNGIITAGNISAKGVNADTVTTTGNIVTTKQLSSESVLASKTVTANEKVITPIVEASNKVVTKDIEASDSIITSTFEADTIQTNTSIATPLISVDTSIQFQHSWHQNIPVLTTTPGTVPPEGTTRIIPLAKLSKLVENGRRITKPAIVFASQVNGPIADGSNLKILAVITAGPRLLPAGIPSHDCDFTVSYVTASNMTDVSFGIYAYTASDSNDAENYDYYFGIRYKEMNPVAGTTLAVSGINCEQPQRGAMGGASVVKEVKASAPSGTLITTITTTEVFTNDYKDKEGHLILHVEEGTDPIIQIGDDKPNPVSGGIDTTHRLVIRTKDRPMIWDDAHPTLSGTDPQLMAYLTDFAQGIVWMQSVAVMVPTYSILTPTFTEIPVSPPDAAQQFYTFADGDIALIQDGDGSGHPAYSTYTIGSGWSAPDMIFLDAYPPGTALEWWGHRKEHISDTYYGQSFIIWAIEKNEWSLLNLPLEVYVTRQEYYDRQNPIDEQLLSVTSIPPDWRVGIGLNGAPNPAEETINIAEPGQPERRIPNPAYIHNRPDYGLTILDGGGTNNNETAWQFVVDGGSVQDSMPVLNDLLSHSRYTTYGNVIQRIRHVPTQDIVQNPNLAHVLAVATDTNIVYLYDGSGIPHAITSASTLRDVNIPMASVTDDVEYVLHLDYLGGNALSPDITYTVRDDAQQYIQIEAVVDSGSSPYPKASNIIIKATLEKKLDYDMIFSADETIDIVPTDPTGPDSVDHAQIDLSLNFEKMFEVNLTVPDTPAPAHWVLHTETDDTGQPTYSWMEVV